MSIQRRGLEVVAALTASAVTGLAVATEYVAWRLGFQSALGKPFAFLGSLPLYEPWRIIDWLPWRDTVPDITTGLFLAAGCAAVPLCAWGVHLLQSPKRSAFGNTEWGTERDAKRAGLLTSSPNGTVLGLWPGGTLLSYHGDEHQLVAGAAGSGKTTGPVISSLLTWPASALVYDPKRELYAQTARYRSRLGEAFYFDPTCPNSARFNPLWEIRSGTVHETGDIQNLVAILIDPGGAKNSFEYWDSDAAKLLTGLVLFALHDLPREEQTLAGVNDMLLAIKATLPLMAKSSHDKCRLIADYIASLPEKQLAGVYGSASAALILYDDPIVAANTSRSDFRISDLVCSEYPLTCYLQVRPTDAVRLRPLIRLILTQVAQALMYDIETAADGRRKQHRLLYLLEEFPSLGRLDFFSTQMRVMRGYGITALLIVQSFKDIINAYGRDQTIVDNCRIVVCFAASDPDSQRMISTMVGTAVEHKESETRPRAGFTWFQGSKSTSEHRRPLLDPGDVRQLGYDEQLVLVTGAKPFRTKKVRWFRHRLLKTLGTNLQRGGVAPGQNQAILDMAAQRDGPAVDPVPHLSAASEVAAAPQDTVLAEIVRLSGWSNSKIAQLLFPDRAELARKWINGTRPLPAEHEAFVAHFLQSIAGLPDQQSVQSFLSETTVERLRNGEVVPEQSA